MAQVAAARSEAQAVQLDLFACFDVPEDVLPSAEVLSLAANDDDASDDPLVAAPIVHRVIPVSEAEPIAVLGPTSVFDMAYLNRPLISSKRPKQTQPPAIYRVHRTTDVIKCVRIQVQDTAEWQEKEAARRARQVVPKPPKQEFRMGKRKPVGVE